ncbi:zinc ribbon domain-containing protein [soil metagenome]
MPTYEFRCESGHATDRFFRSMGNSPAVIECPECGVSAVRQVSGGIGLVFKGSGFYITDYGKDGKKAQLTGQQAGGKPETTGDGGSAPKSEVSGSGSDAAGAKKSDISSPATAKPDAGSPPKKTSGE